MQNVHSTRIVRTIATLGVVALVAIGVADTASAGQASTVLGSASCDTSTGEQVVSWTFTYTYPLGPGVINSAVVDATSLTAGSTIDTSAMMSPSTGLNSLDTSVGTTRVSGDAVGAYKLVITFTPPQLAADFSTGTVQLPGGCVADTTTAPSSTPGTTTLDTTPTDSVGSTIAAGATSLPDTTSTAVAGAGGLPGTGGTSPALPIIGATLIGIGGVLLLARRRGTQA